MHNMAWKRLCCNKYVKMTMCVDNFVVMNAYGGVIKMSVVCYDRSPHYACPEVIRVRRTASSHFCCMLSQCVAFSFLDAFPSLEFLCGFLFHDFVVLFSCVCVCMCFKLIWMVGIKCSVANRYCMLTSVLFEFSVRESTCWIGPCSCWSRMLCF